MLLCAYLAGSVCAKFKQPPLVGFVLAGILLGPSGFEVIASRIQVENIADLGVLLLLFLIGASIPVDVFRRIWKKSLVICLLQLIVGVGAIALVLDPKTAMVIGAAVALSSTATATRLITNMRLRTHTLGKLTTGVLIAQDIAFIPLILVIGAVAHYDAAEGFWKVSLALGGFAVLLLGLKRKINLPFAELCEKNKEILLLQGATLCIGAAALADFAGLKPAYGALLGGMIVANSYQAKAMHDVMKPLENITVMVFFVSIGLLIDLTYLGEHVALITGLVLAVLILKTAVNIIIYRLAGEPWTHAFISSMLIAQVGELSFLVWRAGSEAALISPAQESALVAVAALSLLSTPLWLMGGQRLLRFILTKS